MAFGFRAKRDGRIGGRDAREVVGQANNLPNTILGLAYGGLGMGVGRVLYELDPTRQVPRVISHNGRTQFFDNPFAGVGAITLGEVTLYNDDPYSDQGRDAWSGVEASEGHPVWEHEQQHVIQGRQLGPLYLPSNLLGGMLAVLHPGDRPHDAWHGPRNWNEVGPAMNPARPWAWSKAP